MENKKIENQVENFAAPILQKLGYEIVDVEYKEYENGMNLTIFIYKDGGVTIEDCQIVNGALDEPLDKLDPTNNTPYSLNISSPGLDRPLKNLRDYERNLNKELKITFNTPDNKQKIIEGVLKNIENGVLTINQKGKLNKIVMQNITEALPVIKF